MAARFVRQALLLAAAVAAFAVTFRATDLDRRVQDALYDFGHQAWLVDARAPLPRAVFYRAPKVGLALVAVLLGLRGWVRWRDAPRHLASAPGRRAWPRASREPLFLFACLALVPALVGAGKRVSGIHCPCEVDRYGGRAPFHALLRPAPPPRPGVRPGRCFPAAHASGGFALMALAFTGTRRLRRAGWGLALGWTMGAYQMARGAHYLSHTVASMLVAWGVALFLAHAFGLETEAIRGSGSRR